MMDNITVSRPDVQVVGKPGAYIIKGKDIVPDLNDPAMKAREKKNEKELKEKEVDHGNKS
jgi:hypothetical protein